MPRFEIFWHDGNREIVERQAPADVAAYIAAAIGCDGLGHEKLDKVHEGERDGWVVFPEYSDTVDFTVEFYAA